MAGSSRYALPEPVQREIEHSFLNRPRASIIEAQAALSLAYRQGVTTKQAMPSDDRALAYAAARMPATYAAVARVIDVLTIEQPWFRPRTLIDVGAGPATATLAAFEAWPTLETACLIEPHGRMRALAHRFLNATGRTAQFVESIDAPYDLAIFAYVLAEVPLDGAQAFVARALGKATVTAIIEPGTPDGFRRIEAVRRAVVSTKQTPATLRILGPCTHSNDCPMIQGAGAGDVRPARWCHFNVRLERTRLHQSIKAAEVPFEDERFAYLVVASVDAAFESEPAQPDARLIADPQRSKIGVALDLCTADGRVATLVPARDKARAKAARKRSWGDRWPAAGARPKEIQK